MITAAPGILNAWSSLAVCDAATAVSCCWMSPCAVRPLDRLLAPAAGLGLCAAGGSGLHRGY